MEQLNLTFDWNPDRPREDQRVRPVEHRDLARFIRTFMGHVKSNGWTPESLAQRLPTQLPNLTGNRTQQFLELYWPIHEAWNKRLADDESVGFEDMLVHAADRLEAGRVPSRYRLVLADEFQDASNARAQLVRALVDSPDRYLLAVGDDWQAIHQPVRGC